MEDASSVAAQPDPSYQQKILVIDDTEVIVEYIVHALQRMGYSRIVTARDGVEGLEKFYDEQPDCVIVDVRMPRLDGYQVVRTIRGDSATAHTPLIILSAFDQPDQQLTGLLSGVDEYLPKTTKPAALAAALRRVMGITQEQREQRMIELANDESADVTTDAAAEDGGASERASDDPPNG
jgi:two-component system alkaline phosphatase synthesis response regulator PhoP